MVGSKVGRKWWEVKLGVGERPFLGPRILL